MRFSRIVRRMCPLVKTILKVLLLVVALAGMPPAVIGRPPRAGPPRPQGAVTQVHKNRT